MTERWRFSSATVPEFCALVREAQATPSLLCCFRSKKLPLIRSCHMQLLCRAHDTVRVRRAHVAVTSGARETCCLRSQNGGSCNGMPGSSQPDTAFPTSSPNVRVDACHKPLSRCRANSDTGALALMMIDATQHISCQFPLSTIITGFF